MIKQYNHHNPLATFDLDGDERRFDQDKFKKWMNKFFCINELIHDKSQTKIFDWSGVAVTTDGVKSSLHYSRVQMQGMIEQDAIVDFGQLNVDDDDDDDDDVSGGGCITTSNEKNKDDSGGGRFAKDDEKKNDDATKVSSEWTEISSINIDDSTVASIIEVGENDMILSNDPGRCNIMFVIAFDAQKNIIFIKVLT